jgi:hypothetical protein
LVRHIAPGDSPKAVALKQSIRVQFRARKNESDEDTIEIAKANAVRALSNYMLYQSAQQDTQLRQAMKDQVNAVQRENKNSMVERLIKEKDERK